MKDKIKVMEVKKNNINNKNKNKLIFVSTPETTKHFIEENSTIRHD